MDIVQVSKEALSLNEIATNNYSSFTLYPHISCKMLRKDEKGNVETKLKFCLTSYFCILFPQLYLVVSYLS